jgi:hypothetical protein
MSLIAWRVSADPVVKPAAQTRAESRVLNVRKQKRERDRLSAGGRWIRTIGTPAEETTFSGLPRSIPCNSSSATELASSR